MFPSPESSGLISYGSEFSHYRALAWGRMTGSNFSPRIIGVTVRQRSSQYSLADRVAVSISSLLIPVALPYPVPQHHFPHPRKLRVLSEAIASRLA
jgi:hypothetical protein